VRSAPEFAFMTANPGTAGGAAGFFGRDEESLLSAERLWQQIFPASGTKLWRECWHWLYGGNPFWSASDCYPLVVYKADGETVGQLGLIPTQVRLDGKWTQAAWCIDYHLLPSHQRQGIGRKLLDCALAALHLRRRVSDRLCCRLQVIPVAPPPAMIGVIKARTGCHTIIDSIAAGSVSRHRAQALFPDKPPSTSP
jgi:GNAT superfamily N-acetyltransferase